MGDSQAQLVQLPIIGSETQGVDLPDETTMTVKPKSFRHRSYKWWCLVTVYAVFVLAGQAVATLLGRLYYDKGGKSKWMATFVQMSAFPILGPFYFLSPSNNNLVASEMAANKSLSRLVIASIYVALGVFYAAICMFHALGLFYLPVSTYSLITASQLGFNALFSFILNSQRFTPFIVNSLVVLTVSSTLLVFEQDHSEDSSKAPKGKFAIGFLCAIGASSGYALMLALTQFVFNKVLKQETFKAVLDMALYPSIVSSVVIVLGIFASGDWKGLHKEMKEFELGTVSYLMTLIWTAICWQVFSVGTIGLIFEVSSLFSNILSTVGLPIIPVMAVFIFHDKMDGVKSMSLVLAVWGFVSYVYQHYLHDFKSKKEDNNNPNV